MVFSFFKCLLSLFNRPYWSLDLGPSQNLEKKKNSVYHTLKIRIMADPTYIIIHQNPTLNRALYLLWIKPYNFKSSVRRWAKKKHISSTKPNNHIKHTRLLFLIHFQITILLVFINIQLVSFHLVLIHRVSSIYSILNYKLTFKATESISIHSIKAKTRRLIISKLIFKLHSSIYQPKLSCISSTLS